MDFRSWRGIFQVEMTMSLHFSLPIEIRNGKGVGDSIQHILVKTNHDYRFWHWSVTADLPCERVWVARLCLPLCDAWNSPSKNTEMGCLSLLQGIFATEGSNLGRLHCRQILLWGRSQWSDWIHRFNSSMLSFTATHWEFKKFFIFHSNVLKIIHKNSQICLTCF